MARSLPVTVIEAVNAQTTGEAFLALLTVTHSSFTTSRIVNNTEDITSNGNTFTAFPFRVVLPPDSEELQPRLRVTVSNVTRLLVSDFRSIAGSRERVECSVSIIMASDPDTVLASWSNFELTNLNYTSENMTFDLVIETFLTEGFPKDSFTPANFPGLF